MARGHGRAALGSGAGEETTPIEAGHRSHALVREGVLRRAGGGGDGHLPGTGRVEPGAPGGGGSGAGARNRARRRRQGSRHLGDPGGRQRALARLRAQRPDPAGVLGSAGGRPHGARARSSLWLRFRVQGCAHEDSRGDSRPDVLVEGAGGRAGPAHHLAQARHQGGRGGGAGEAGRAAHRSRLPAARRHQRHPRDQARRRAHRDRLRRSHARGSDRGCPRSRVRPGVEQGRVRAAPAGVAGRDSGAQRFSGR